MTIPKPAADRFWPKVDTSGSCWVWTAGIDGSGYGQFRLSTTRKIVAHRFAYTALIGEIPEGMQLDHLCRNRACVNPAHLEPVTNRQNTLRGEGLTAQYARQTECKRGHPFTPENTYVTKRGHRACRACGRDRRRYAAMIGGGR